MDEEAGYFVSFCTRMYIYIRNFKKDATMVPRFCIDWNPFLQDSNLRLCLSCISMIVFDFILSNGETKI